MELQDNKFELKSEYKPSWDQPKAIQQILKWFSENKNIQTLLWATGTGKTFTIANVIQEIQKPTLVISHNKTLAAQLSTELKHFFPNNAVHYFVSYFDYYQPESYLPDQGLYIEKESTINQEIELYRLATMASLLSRKDVIVVASVSSIYGIGESEYFLQNMLQLQIGKKYDFKEIKKALLKMQYEPVNSKVEHWMFDLKWDIFEIYSSTEKCVYRCFFDEDLLERVEIRDFTTFKLKSVIDHWMVTFWPASQFIQDTSSTDSVLAKIEEEKELRYKEFKDKWLLVEAERIKKRAEYDVRMIRETWVTNWIENYSLYFDNRNPWEAPNTLFDYFPEDMLCVVDESHLTIWQFQAMPKADKSRKFNLIKHWFRLPSAIDHRPWSFDELEAVMWWKDIMYFDKKDLDFEKENISNTYQVLIDKAWKSEKILKKNRLSALLKKEKKQAKTVFMSATPAEYELKLSSQIVEQIIRPTGLLDPITYLYPKSGSYDELEKSLKKLLEKKPYLKEFLDWYTLEESTKDIFKS